MFSDLKDIFYKNRSYRRFYQSEAIETSSLKEMIDCARVSASSRNLQAIRYFIVNDSQRCKTLFSHLGWAGYLPQWAGPEEGERPSAYILMLGDKVLSMNLDVDTGICAQSILLAATALGYGGCMIGTINRLEIKIAFTIPDDYDILLCIALGKPKEKVVLEEIDEKGCIKYWRDEDQTHHTPKRKLEDIIVNFY